MKRPPYFVVVIAGMLFPAMAAAQQGKLKKWAEQIIALTQKENLLLPTPILDRRPETGWNYGLGTNFFFKLAGKDSQQAARPSHLYASATYSQNRQLQAKLQWTLFTRGGHYLLQGRADYRYLYDRYWGTGNTAPDSALQEYTAKKAGAQGQFLRYIGHNKFLGLYLNAYRLYDFTWKASLPYQPSVKGDENHTVFSLGPALILDYRNNPFLPLKGWYAETYFAYSPRLFGNRYHFHQWNTDLRKYFSLGHLRSLALQLEYARTKGDLPFRELARLGNSTSMRGFYNGRFTDRELLVLQAEYRFPVWKILRGTVFLSSGRVAPRFYELFQKGWKWSAGGGPRFVVNEKSGLSIALDVARTSTGKTEYYFRFFEAF